VSRRILAWSIAIAAAAGIAWAVDRQTAAVIRSVNGSALDTLRALQGRPIAAADVWTRVDVDPDPDPDPPAITTWRGFALELVGAGARYVAARARAR
jgi:hypothetical protein